MKSLLAFALSVFGVSAQAAYKSNQSIPLENLVRMGCHMTTGVTGYSTWQYQPQAKRSLVATGGVTVNETMRITSMANRLGKGVFHLAGSQTDGLSYSFVFNQAFAKGDLNLAGVVMVTTVASPFLPVVTSSTPVGTVYCRATIK